jgi:hypothetical protein
LKNVLEPLSKNLQKYIYILIGLEETNTAVYINVVLTLIEHSKIEFKGLGEHETCGFEAFFDECSRTIEKNNEKVYVF